MTKAIVPIARMPRVATIASMASRIETFQKVLPMIHAQVDHVFIYLDGYSAPPSFLQGLDRVSVHRAEHVGNLHSSSRLLCLRDLAVPSVVATVDDDIAYPPDYIERLVDALVRVDGQAVVGVHGRIFIPPHRSYVRDAIMMHFAYGLDRPRHVHELGSGTCAFVSSRLDVDPRQWDQIDMDDIVVAIQAQRRGLARVAMARSAGWLKAYSQAQPDSLWAKTKINDAEQSRQMRALLGLYA